MKRITIAAWISLLPLLGAFIWYWLLHAERYFPGRYEDAFRGTAIALLVAVPGALFLLFRFGYLLGQWLRSKTA